MDEHSHESIGSGSKKANFQVIGIVAAVLLVIMIVTFAIAKGGNTPISESEYSVAPKSKTTAQLIRCLEKDPKRTGRDC